LGELSADSAGVTSCCAAGRFNFFMRKKPPDGHALFALDDPNTGLLNVPRARGNAAKLTFRSEEKLASRLRERFVRKRLFCLFSPLCRVRFRRDRLLTTNSNYIAS
jgi:hypothetical protein